MANDDDDDAVSGEDEGSSSSPQSGTSPVADRGPMLIYDPSFSRPPEHVSIIRQGVTNATIAASAAARLSSSSSVTVAVPAPSRAVHEPRYVPKETNSSLPLLLRTADERLHKVRSRFRYSAHHLWERFGENFAKNGGDLGGMEDPYSGVVVWAKLTGHPYWPVRLATEEEKETMWVGKFPELAPIQSLDEDCGGNAADVLMLYFLGSHQLGTARRSMIEPFVARYKDFAGKCGQKAFALGIEEADGEAMRNRFAEGVGSCMVCGGTEDPMGIILCDRCNSEAHMKCLKPPMTEVPEGDWLCPVCAFEAPHTVEFMEAHDERMRRQEEKDHQERRLSKANSSGKESSLSPVKVSIMGGSGGQKGVPYTREKVSWTTEEDATLLQGLFDTQVDWDEVVRRMSHRTISGLKNRHNVLLRKGRAPPLVYMAGRDESKTISQAKLNVYLKAIEEQNPVDSADAVDNGDAVDDEDSSTLHARILASPSDIDSIALTKQRRIRILPPAIGVAAAIAAVEAPRPAPSLSLFPPVIDPTTMTNKPNGSSSSIPPMQSSSSSTTTTTTTTPTTTVANNHHAVMTSLPRASSASTVPPEAKKQKLHTPPPQQATAATTTTISTTTSKPKQQSTKQAPSSSSQAQVTSQLGQILDEILAKRKRERSSAVQSSYCFVCNLPDPDVQCDDENCDRMYHAFCLGAGGEGSDDVNTPWYCPWHYCALCPRPSHSTPPPPPALLPAKYTNPPSLTDLAGSAKWIRTATGGATTTTSSSIFTSRAISIMTGPNGTAARGEEQEEEEENIRPRLSRCCACPLALCAKHVNASCQLHLGPAAGVQTVAIQRLSSAPMGFFACERCAGLSPATVGARARYFQQIPRVVLARHHDRVLSDLLTKHEDLFGFLVQAPSKQMVQMVAGMNAVAPFFSPATTANKKPLSLGEIQKRNRLLQYDSTDELQEDVIWLAEHFGTLFERTQPRLAEAARTLPHLLSEIILQRAKDLLNAEQQSREDLKFFEQELEENGGYHHAHSLFTAVACLRGATPWESYERKDRPSQQEEKTLRAWNDRVYRDRNEQGPRDSRNTFALLAQSLEAAKLMPKSSLDTDVLTAPTRAELEHMFEDHSAQLRSALRSAAELRFQVGRVLSVVDGLSRENLDFFEPVLNLGGTRRDAEQQAANRALRAKLDETRQALELEQRARHELEERLAKLEGNGDNVGASGKKKKNVS